MRKLYKKREVLFAVLWIAAYCSVMAPLKGKLGWDSIWMLLALLLFASGITVFVKANRLETKYGLAGWPKNAKRCLYFIPMWILATGNLWAGFAPTYQGMALLTALLSMILVGYVEEMIFRGFLFKAMLSEGNPAAAVTVSSLTFGIGHIINLFTGQGSTETVIQIVFAVSWGFILTMVFYKSGSLIPCIIAHAVIDASSILGADNVLIDKIYVTAAILVAIAYCIYLGKLPTPESERKQQ